MTRARITVVAATVLLVSALLGAPAANADTASDLKAARDALAEAEGTANAAAAELSAAENRYESLGARITESEANLDQAQRRAEELKEVVRHRAVFAYTHAGSVNSVPILESGDLTDAVRKTRLLDLVNRRDDSAIQELAALRDDLRAQQDELRRQRASAQQVKDQLEAKSHSLQEQLAKAAKARDALASKLSSEQAAGAELARLRASSGGSYGVGQVIVNPGGGPFQCPVYGAAYSDNYGPRGSGFHYGIDMFAPDGAPEVAVKAGYVNFVPNEGGGGNTVYLSANDGNVYFYAHLSAYVGGPRPVAQGEVLGYVGSTGNAAAPHLHFEIRLGGANGERINPYPTLRSAGC